MVSRSLGVGNPRGCNVYQAVDKNYCFYLLSFPFRAKLKALSVSYDQLEHKTMLHVLCGSLASNAFRRFLLSLQNLLYILKCAETSTQISVSGHKMPSLPDQPFTLTGGCYCQAIRYTISVPELSARPRMPEPLEVDKSIGDHDPKSACYPQVETDHCSMCRRIHGSVVVVWFMLLRSWLQLSLLPKGATTSSSIQNDKDSRLQLDTTEVLKGVPDVVNTTFVTMFSSSKDAHRIFCSRCGTHITLWHDSPDDTPESEQKVDIAFGSLDPEFLEWEALKPVVNGWEVSGIGWVRRWLRDGEQTLSGA